MSSTTVGYRGAEFVANDLPIEVWMLEVANRIAADANVDPWLNELKEEWTLQATSGFGFGPAPALDSFLNTADRRERLAHYFRRAIDSLSQRNSIITPDELRKANVGGDETFYTQELRTQMVIDIGNQFLALLS
jgi:hypothetical protein